LAEEELTLAEEAMQYKIVPVLQTFSSASQDVMQKSVVSDEK
jgi:hypothetical protein